MKLIALTLIILLSSGCQDIIERKDTIIDPYFVADNLGTLQKTLYYDLGDGNSIGRLNEVKRVGYTKTHIIAEKENGFYFIDREKDHKYLNGSDIVGKVQSREYFLNWLDSMEIQDFLFTYFAEK
jgi:hypothetical protein